MQRTRNSESMLEQSDAHSQSSDCTARANQQSVASDMPLNTRFSAKRVHRDVHDGLVHLIWASFGSSESGLAVKPVFMLARERRGHESGEYTQMSSVPHEASVISLAIKCQYSRGKQVATVPHAQPAGTSCQDSILSEAPG